MLLSEYDDEQLIEELAERGIIVISKKEVETAIETLMKSLFPSS